MSLIPKVERPAAPIAPELPTIDPLLSVVGLDAPTEAQMLFYYDNPHLRPKGETTHIAALDPIFKWVPGWTNLATAQPGVGKSQFKRELLLLRAALAQKKSLSFVPEDMPREAFYDMCIHSLTGHNPTGPNPLPRLYYQRAMEWVREYLYVIQFVKGQGRTPEHLLDIYEAARVKLDISHFNTDPWHKLDHSGQQAAGGVVPYLTRELGRFTDWAGEVQVYSDITINPRSIARGAGEAWPVPDTDHLSGGPVWADFSATVTAFDRPNRHTARADPSFAIYTRKIKNYTRADARPSSIGTGSENPDVLVEFDWKTARYYFNGIAALADPRIQAIYAPDLAAQATTAARTTLGSLPASTFDDEPVAFPPLPVDADSDPPF